jgi:hypothetical protein
MTSCEVEKLLKLAMEFEELQDLIADLINEKDPEYAEELRQRIIEEFEILKEHNVDVYEFIVDSKK